tara:strand:- start:500 stop:1087 length:588 start_codon:yes stop_codon:yes gene_type:complete
MSLDLSDIKDKLAGTKRALRTNKFSVDLTLFNPLSGSYTSIVDYPAAGVSSPTTGIQAALFEYQNIPLQVPIKRQNQNQLQITFYATEDLEVYSTLVSLIKLYGGESSYSSSASGNQPTVYNENNMYNRAIRDNVMYVRLKSSLDGSNVNYIGYSEVYPSNILPIEFNSAELNNIGTFSVLFNYARTTTQNIGNS